jgi:hypothetical protein
MDRVWPKWFILQVNPKSDVENDKNSAEGAGAVCFLCFYTPTSEISETSETLLFRG